MIGAVWSVPTAYVAHNALPHNPLKLPYARELSDILTTATPQGWRFFTRDPREPKAHLYANAGGRWASAALGPTARPIHAFGLNRRARAQGMEYAWLVTHARASDWSDCDGEVTRCLDEAAAAVANIESRVPHPTLCGRIGIARQPAVPWAWRANRASLQMPAQVIVFDVDCGTGAVP
jgi:antimicrobial peptide system SdpA family protein